jgi:hypothetical protein
MSKWQYFPLRESSLYSLLMGKEYYFFPGIQYSTCYFLWDRLGNIAIPKLGRTQYLQYAVPSFIAIVHAVLPSFPIVSAGCIANIQCFPGIQWSVYYLVFSEQYFL